VAFIIRSTYEDGKASEWLGSRTQVPFVVLPHTVGSVPGTDDLFGLFDTVVKTLMEARK
jgi:zinc/manganese transport system substrate-binding protein